MKKIININLSGRVIPIEDAAYESLQAYIESLRRYFVHEEGRDEIINDIESRIAELMNDKVKKGAAAVTEADIEEIISSMGRIEDFEEVDAEGSATAATAGATGSSNPFSNFKAPRGRLYRDSNDKILGGVCSGIGNYLNLDPALIRILLVLLIFGAGTGLLLYIILWIFVPARPLSRVSGKRLFRNPDDRVLGGVAGGLGTYFGKEPWVIRLIFAAPLLLNIVFGILNGLFFAFERDIFPNFVIGSFTGTFIITYIILWIILPEAKSTYEKMEMRGENVDVNRIKQNVQSEMKAFGAEVKETAEKWGNEAKNFATTRGRSFAEEASAAIQPIGRSAGNIIGLIFKVMFMAIAGFIALILFIVVLTALSSGIMQPFNDFMLNGTGQKTAFWGTLLFFIAVPLIAIITWIVRRIMKVRSQNRYLGWTFGGLWTLGWICLMVFIASMVQDWRMSEQVEQPVSLIRPALEKLTVRIDEPRIRYSGTFDWINDNDRNDDGGWDLTRDTLRLSNVKIRAAKSPDSLYHVTLWKESRGRNRAEALRRAEAITYTVSSLDSALILGSGFSIYKDQKFRGQQAIVEIEIPVGKKIRFDETVQKLSVHNIRIAHNRKWRRDDWEMDWDMDNFYDWEPGVDYVMTEEGKLVDPNKSTKKDAADYEYNGSGNDSLSDSSLEKQRELLDQQIEERRRKLDVDIEQQRKKLEEEQRRLEDLQRKKDGSAKAPAQKKSLGLVYIQSPVFSLI